MSEKNDFVNYKEQTLTRPRDAAWGNWKSWTDKVGENVQGYVADAFFRPEEHRADGTLSFRSQRGLTIKQVDGVLINVGVKDLAFVLAATDNLRVGDPLTIELTEIKAPAEKGMNGAKIYSYFGKNLDENKDAKTVKELTDEDRADGGSSAPEEDTLEAVAEDINVVVDNQAF